MSWSAPDEWSRWDPERLIQCPYDQAHMIKAKRYQHHLLKCREKYPDRDFVNCPFNAKHVMLRSEVRHHFSRCPDRSVIEQYSYKGSEQDDSGFYFKGNTSVPSYHRSEELQRGAETWDESEEGQTQWTHERESVSSHQATSELRDTSSLSPEEQRQFKRSLKRDAVLKGINSNAAPFWKSSTVSGTIYNQVNSKTNPIFDHCMEQLQVNTRITAQETERLQLHSENEAHVAPESKNQRFGSCVHKLQDDPRYHETDNSNIVSHSCEQEFHPVFAIESSGSLHNGLTSVHRNIPTRHGSVKSDSENNGMDSVQYRPEVGVVSNICGSPTSSTPLNKDSEVSPQLAGAGRARLHAEARKNNFGGICHSSQVLPDADSRRPPTIGRGRGMLNFMFSPGT